MSKIKAVLFDLHGSLAYMENPLSEEEILEYLFQRGYEVTPQQLKAAWMFVAFVDYPQHGYKSWRSYFSRIFWRLKVRVDKNTLNGLAKLLEQRNIYRLYTEAAEATIKAKESGLKTAIVTTIAYFQFKKAVKPIKEYLDLIMTGFEAKCDKSSPKMYRKVLEKLKVKPEEAVMIGDDVKVDVLLPKQLGMHTILLNRKEQYPECKVADAVAENLTQAVKIILSQNIK
ncbi:MAG: HAD family hydrolase [Candidatus Bathycorpusculaceae bacterium]